MDYAEDAVGKAVFVSWQEGRSQATSWYEGVVESYDEGTGEHLVKYHFDGERVATDLAEQEQLGLLVWKAPTGFKAGKAASRSSSSSIPGAAAKKQASQTKRPTKRARPAEKEKEEEEEEEEEEAEAAADAAGEAEGEAAAPPTRGGRAPRRAAAVKAIRQYAKMVAGGSDVDDSDFEDAEGNGDEDDLSDRDDSVSSGRKRKRPATPRAKAASKRGKATASAGPPKPVGQKPVGVSFRKPAPKKPARARKRPPKQESQPFVDPAGLDIEDRGVEWIVEAQCERLLPLIQDAVKHGEMTQLSMATACSGTDAPVIAMQVVQEMLERRFGLAFDFQHVMSCELEPYKQSFIARNHPGVLLFPDIRTLGNAKRGATATTVYGGQAAIPEADMIVVGTSCKDFSNLKGHDRKSIEAMGTSGETFIGFVDLLFEQGYATAILENVQGAEWDKMAHYITGELPLWSLKPNSGQNRHAPQELTFTVQGKALVVAEVSEFAGVRLGAVLKGYTSQDAVDGKVTPIPAASFKGSVGVDALAKKLGLDGGATLIFETPLTYRTKLLDMDAKEFGLPQTRTRKYMLIWRPDKYPDGADVAELWTDLVDSLRVSLKYSVDSFLLNDENDRVHRFRDALQGPLGRLTAMEKQSGDWFGENANRDTQHTKDYRNVAAGYKGKNCLSTPAEERARPFTNWGPNGDFTLASGRWWPEYISVLNQRELDLLDCFGIRAAEAGFDALHHSLWWNVSQNVGRTDVIPRPGITGCITPGGENFGPHRGRCILGYEKLLLGGIPVDKLQLGTETEVQLADLAGNAMAMPVVSAAILGAMLVPAYARRLQADDSFELCSLEAATASPVPNGAPSADEAGAGGKAAKGAQAAKSAKGSRAAKVAKAAEASAASSAASPIAGGELLECLQALLPLCAGAESTSVLCTCETCGAVSDSGIVRCPDCLLTVCRACGSRSDLRSHQAGAPIDHACCTSGLCRRDGPSPAEFEHVLRREAPTTLTLDAPSAATLSDLSVELPRDGEYTLTRVVRERGNWMLGYSVCDPLSGTPLAELRISVGRLGTGRGIAALLFSFAAARRGERGRMPPVARLLLPADGATAMASQAATGKKAAGKAAGKQPVRAAASWEVLRAPRPCELRLSATSRVPSYRAEVGLLDYASEEWPDELRVDGDAAVAGVYARQTCRFSCVFGALWRRRDGTRWLFVRPTVDRTAPDEIVIATSPSYLDCDTHELLAVVPVKHGAKAGSAAKAAPAGKAAAAKAAAAAKVASAAAEQPPFGLLCTLGAPKAKETTVRARAKVWEAVELRFIIPVDSVKVAAHEFGSTLSSLPAATTRKLLDAAASSRLGMVGGAGADAQGWHELRVLTASSTVVERRLAEAVAAPLLQFAASGGLKALSSYQLLKRTKGEPQWGSCTRAAPERPAEIWDADGRRTYDVEASNAFERALRARPSAWDVRVSASNALRVAAVPTVAAHRAAEALLRGRALDPSALRVEWLIDTQRSTLAAAPMTSFLIPTSRAYAAANDAPPFFRPDKKLYERQARGLGRMLAVDAGEVPFDELEYSDHAISSGVGWTLKVKVSRPAALPGGVLADAVGAGKTIVAIALIASRAKAARASAAKSSDLQHSGATLVVAPVFSLKPVWKQLLGEFTSGLKAIVIEQLSDLKACSVDDIRTADVVIVACELLYNLKEKEPEAYQRHLVELTQSDDFPPFLEGRKQSRLIGSEPDILTGVWVPNSSQDPFGRSKARQEDRDVAAYFTVRYQECLRKLRTQKFKGTSKGVPLEWFTFERLIIDECHESLVLGEDDAERKAASAFSQEKAMQKEKRKCAQRELLGIGQTDVESRPFRARNSAWGLTGTPLLSSEARITELAALCGGTYVCGNAAHWRTMERASTRDVFLRYHESASSLVYLEERTKAAQAYIDAAVMRNRIDGELSHISRAEATVECKLAAGSAYEKLVEKHEKKKNGGAAGGKPSSAKSKGLALNPSPGEVSETAWEELLTSLAEAPARQQALCKTIEGIRAKGAGTKVVVFAPPGPGFEAARKALGALQLKGLRRPVLIGDPNDAGCTDAILEFSRPDIRDPNKPVVLLLSFDYSSALNLQHVSHNIIFYAPLWGDDPSGIHAASNEQQAIGRVLRIGQVKDVVVHRIVAVGPQGQDTIERRVVERNMRECVTLQAVNT